MTTIPKDHHHQKEKDANFNFLVYSLDRNNMSNKHHYKNVICLSQRIQHKINQLKSLSTRRNNFYQCSNINFNTNTRREEEDDDLLLLTSPTETIIAYYDEYYDHNTKYNRGRCKFYINNVYIQTGFNKLILQ